MNYIKQTYLFLSSHCCHKFPFNQRSKAIMGILFSRRTASIRPIFLERNSPSTTVRHFIPAVEPFSTNSGGSNTARESHFFSTIHFYSINFSNAQTYPQQQPSQQTECRQQSPVSAVIAALLEKESENEKNSEIEQNSKLKNEQR